MFNPLRLSDASVKCTIIGSDNGLSPVRTKPLSEQCQFNVDWTFGNKLQWHFYQVTTIFIDENAFENVVCKMGDILYHPQCVDVIDFLCHTDWITKKNCRLLGGKIDNHYLTIHKNLCVLQIMIYNAHNRIYIFLWQLNYVSKMS